MNTYRNISGKSGIVGFNILQNGILVKFTSGTIYEYTFESAGKNTIDIIRNLAMTGIGLNGFLVREANRVKPYKLHSKVY